MSLFHKPEGEERFGQCPYDYEGFLGFDVSTGKIYCLKCNFHVLIKDLDEVNYEL